MSDEKVTCRTPNARGATRIPAWKFRAVRRAILTAVKDAGAEGFPFGKVNAAVEAGLSREELDALGSVGWHATSVKLELEVAGEIARVPGVTPQRLVLGDNA